MCSRGWKKFACEYVNVLKEVRRKGIIRGRGWRRRFVRDLKREEKVEKSGVGKLDGGWSREIQ